MAVPKGWIRCLSSLSHLFEIRDERHQFAFVRIHQLSVGGHVASSFSFRFQPPPVCEASRDGGINLSDIFSVCFHVWRAI